MRSHFRMTCAAGLTILCLLIGCIPPELPPTVNTDLDVCLRDPGCTAKLSVGHRGTGSLGLWAPENTLAGHEMAWKMGADSVEVDVRDTLDGVPVLMHDSTVDRTTDGTGAVADMTLEEIQALSIHALNPIVPVQSVPTFSEALAYLRGKMMVYVDIKSVDVPHLVEVIESEGMINAAYLLIGSIAEGDQARSQNPDVALMPVVSSEAEVDAYLDALSPIIMFEIAYEDVTPEIADLVHGHGIKIHMDALGLHDLQGIAGYNTLLAAGTDSIQTDCLELLVPFLRSLP